MPLRKNDLEAYNVNIHQSLAITIGQCMTNFVDILANDNQNKEESGPVCSDGTVRVAEQAR